MTRFAYSTLGDLQDAAIAAPEGEEPMAVTAVASVPREWTVR
jgi:hypothetical protein